MQLQVIPINPSLLAAVIHMETSVSVDQAGNLKEDVRGAVIHQAKHTVTVAQWVKNDQQG